MRSTRWLTCCAVALALAACGGSSSSTTTTRAGNPIPTRFPPADTAAPGVTTPNGAPRVVEFMAPNRFQCLSGYPNRAQVTLGWLVPSASAVSLALDGRRLPVPALPRIYATARPPFEVPAGGPSSVGATVVFPCVPGRRHTIAVSWQAGAAPAARRVVTVTKGRS